ncbi:hypothetical protein [Rhizobium tubonense]|uniref:Uncharacterized protein n=1 Tax=Rhizobium tubonense TaxID=484088 RepID=A0A2W4EBB5_9HYPH|nr:hypothetical protein [Rhizobium tubonense]PZM08840.1 hypothetical protein CPY51_28155 [Rhizobium tubonense]
MWLRLELDEIDLILSYIPEGLLADKLKKEPHADTAAFVRAVATDDDLEVDDDAVISRGDDGAFVMSWSWISNQQAGLPEYDEDDDTAEASFGVALCRCPQLP